MIDYKQILDERHNFRSRGDSKLRFWDTPINKFMKVCFHFFDEGGLLHPTYLYINPSEPKEVQQKIKGRANELVYWNYSSAWSYLMQNDDEERATKLKFFIELLSGINSETPWYFQSVNEVPEAINNKNKFFEGTEDFSNGGTITLKTLEDSQDERIGTLLDLYTNVCYDNINKREIVPGNLRRFNMSIFYVSQPILGLHTPNTYGGDFASLDGDYKPSYKKLEFHNCEFDITSFGGGYNETNLVGGMSPIYEIKIKFGDVLEYRYNEFFPELGEFGDIFESKILGYSEDLDDDIPIIKEKEKLVNHIIDSRERLLQNRPGNLPQGVSETKVPGFFDKWKKYIPELPKPKDRVEVDNIYYGKTPRKRNGILSQLASPLTTKILNKVDNIILGNIYETSISKLSQEVQKVLNGDISIITSKLQ